MFAGWYARPTVVCGTKRQFQYMCVELQMDVESDIWATLGIIDYYQAFRGLALEPLARS